jgi:hypothetical protein
LLPVAEIEPDSNLQTKAKLPFTKNRVSEGYKEQLQKPVPKPRAKKGSGAPELEKRVEYQSTLETESSDSDEEEIRTRVVKYRPAGPKIDKHIKETPPLEAVSSHEDKSTDINVDDITIDEHTIDDSTAEVASTEPIPVPPQVVPRKSKREKKKPVWYDSYVVGQQTVDKFLELNLQNTKLMVEMFKSFDK